ncbi:MAG: cardiolipin synthase [Prevotellaceae bacterium]|nr:cardiolipin synthase [Prevotellaceae bacterium]
MIYVNWLVLLIYTLLFIGTAIAVLLDKKEPVKTLAWMLVLVFLPVAGIVLFFFFGQNTRRKRIIHHRALSQLTKRSIASFNEQKNLDLPIEHKGLIQLFINQNIALPFKDNVSEVFTNGKDMFDALLNDIHRAKHHIHLETYIFDDDSLGRRISDALIAKSREGVEVRILYDDVGCWRVPNAFFERMRMEGINARSFLPVRFPLFTSKINYRNHRKICVIDGQVGYIGGMNIADRYIDGDGTQPWRDTHLRITGKAVYGLQSTFLADWFFMDRTLITDRKYYPTAENAAETDCFMQIVTSSSISKWCDIMQGYVRIIANAKKYVYLESPYFVPSQPVLFALQTAAMSGIDVRIILPEKSDNFFVGIASRSFFYEVMKAGVKIYLYKKGFNHSKILICDDNLSSVGSTNIDVRSFENNMEVNAFIYDTEMAVRLRHVFEDDMDASELIDMQSIRKSLPARIGESIVRMLSPLL